MNLVSWCNWYDFMHVCLFLVVSNLGPQVSIQEKLLEQQNHTLKPEEKFLKSFADIVGSKWPSLAASLSLSAGEIEEVKLARQDHALKMLTKWAAKEDATYGQLYRTLKTIPLFQHT